MNDPTDTQGTVTAPSSPVARPDRPPLIAFAADGQTEIALRDGLAGTTAEAPEIRRGGIRAAVAAMQKGMTPRVLIVDTGGEEDPLAMLAALAEVTEPDASVLVIGDPTDLDFYRAVTRSLGAREYLPRPLSRDQVALHFGALVSGQARSERSLLGSQVITITGARGGAGASTIALNLAWHFGVSARRHTVLLDPDLHMGVSAFLLNLRPGPGLRLALEAPDRIDALLAERAALPAAERLHVLAGHEKLTTPIAYAAGTAGQLLEALRRRYNFVITDVPFRPLPLYGDLLDLANQRVLVLEPTLASVRDGLRLLALPAGPQQSRRPIVVLNRTASVGGLPRRQVEDAIGLAVDVAIPNLPRQVSGAATLGEPAVARHSGFRAAIAELARQVAPPRMADAGASTAETDARPRLGLRRLLRRAA